MLLRFVDVVMILLFGFISISEITVQRGIELARSAETPKTPLDTMAVFLVGVTAEGSLVVGESTHLDTPGELVMYFDQWKQTYGASRVRVRVRPDSLARTALIKEVLRLCDEKGFSKEIGVYYVQAAPPKQQMP